MKCAADECGLGTEELLEDGIVTLRYMCSQGTANEEEWKNFLSSTRLRPGGTIFAFPKGSVITRIERPPLWSHPGYLESLGFQDRVGMLRDPLDLVLLRRIVGTDPI